LTEFTTSRWAVSRIPSKSSVDEVDETDRKRRPKMCEVSWIALQAGKRCIGIRLTEEGNATCEALVQHKNKQIQIGPTVKFVPAHLLWRKVFRGAHHDVVAGEVVFNPIKPFSNSEVSEQNASIFGDENVPWFYISMDESSGVGGI
jgi:hypothetical protein